MVFDSISWGQIIVLSGLAITVVGRKDLPAASHAFGKQVGRVVGLLLGARQRLDKFAANNELKQLQNELRMGLRELDAIKTELVVASSTGLMGRELGGTLGRQVIRPNTTNAFPTTATVGVTTSNTTTSSNTTRNPALTSSLISTNITSTTSLSTPTPLSLRTATSSIPEENATENELTSREHSVAAIAEEEWQKRGIGFKSRAEMGTFGSWASNSASSKSASQSTSGGATILADFIQQNLIYDQYDRVTQEQEEMLRSKANRFRTNQEEGTKNETK